MPCLVSLPYDTSLHLSQYPSLTRGEREASPFLRQALFSCSHFLPFTARHKHQGARAAAKSCTIYEYKKRPHVRCVMVNLVSLDRPCPSTQIIGDESAKCDRLSLSSLAKRNPAGRMLPNPSTQSIQSERKTQTKKRRGLSPLHF